MTVIPSGASIPNTVLAVLAVALVAGCAPRLEPAGPAIAAPSLDRDAFIAGDGARLPVRRWLPNGPVRSVLVGLHGFNDYSNAFDGPARYWAKRGIATYAYDQRGFGRAPNRGLWAGTETMAADLAAFVRSVRARHPGLPVHVVGISMGGAVALVAATGKAPLDVDGAVLAAPAVWGRRTMGAISRFALWAMSNSVPWLTVSGEGLEIRPSDNIEMLRALGRDKNIIHYTRVDAIKGLVDLMDAAFAAPAKLRLPTLFLYGGRDQIVPREATHKALKTLPADVPSRIALYTNGYHMLLRDLKAERVWADIAAWIDDHDVQLPSGANQGIESLTPK